MLKKKENVSVMIREQLKDVEGCLINFENFVFNATTTTLAESNKFHP